MPSTTIGAAAFGLFACASLTWAQEAMYTQAATMPSPGTGVFRQQFHYRVYGLNPSTGAEKTERYEAMSSVSYGLDRGLALTIDVPVALERTTLAGGSSDWDRGISDFDLTLKYRVYKDDTGGVDTARAAILGGAAIASGDDHDFSSTSVNPYLGAVLTVVRGRHGFDVDAIYRLNTGGTRASNLGGEGPDDAFRYDLAYLYRLAPERYTSDSVGAWYVTAEINGLYETGGDHDIRFSPGLMYEGRTWGFEVMAQFPLYQHVRDRPEFDLAVGFGVRLAF
jgi:hypothetical protein